MSDLGELPEDEANLDQARGKVRKSPTAFRTISEVADELHIPQHVLRFWETKFPQVRPLKRGGGRRYYRPDDLALLKRISDLLYIQGYTIKGVQRLLREGPGYREEDGPASVAEAADEADEADGVEGELDPAQVADEDLDGVARSAATAAVAEPTSVPYPGPPPPGPALDEPTEGEVERLRAALREALAALESLRARLG